MIIIENGFTPRPSSRQGKCYIFTCYMVATEDGKDGKGGKRALFLKLDGKMEISI